VLPGRLYEKCLELLQGADIQFKRAHRLDVALVQNHPMALVFLPAADIPRFVGQGNVDLGITGQDMVAEAGANVSALVEEVLELGFGKCSLQVQVPETSSLKTVEDLVGKKVATSFDYLAGQYFAEKDKAKGVETQIEFVGGSVEAACALGLADGIGESWWNEQGRRGISLLKHFPFSLLFLVDLVESGETMRACGLHPIATLLKSQAVLIRSKKAHERSNTELIDLITRRLRGVIAASRYVLVTYNVDKPILEKVLKITPGRRSATVMPLDHSSWSAVQAMVLRNDVALICDELEAIGAQDILVMQLANCRIER
jgi:ATP phosphoribosyltransferase